MSKVIELKCATLTVLDDQLLKIVYKNDYQVDLSDAKEVDDFYVNFSKGKGVFSIMDTQGRYSVFTSEAQEFFAKEAKLVNEGQMLGNALVIDSLPNRLLAKFFLRFYTPEYPCKIFSNYTSAKQWVDELRYNMK